MDAPRSALACLRARHISAQSGALELGPADLQRALWAEDRGSFWADCQAKRALEAKEGAQMLCV